MEHRHTQRASQRPRRSRTGRLTAATVVLLAMVLAACGSDQREDIVAESSGQVERTESVDALNLVLVTNGDGVARLIGTLINQADEQDRLIGLDVDAEPTGFSFSFADGPYAMPEGEQLRLYRDADVTVISEAFAPGYRADVTLVFANSEPLTTTVPIERNTGIYKDIEVTRPPDGDIRPGN